MNRKRLNIFLAGLIMLTTVFFFPNAVLAKKDKSKKGGSKAQSEAPLTKADIELQAIFIEGMQAYLLGNPQDAVAKFNEVLRRDPKNDAALYQLAKIAFESGNMDKAIQYAQSAIRINPNNEYYYQYLAEAKGEKQDFDGASKTYETLLKLKPKEYDYYYDWAYMLAKAGKYKEAIDVYNLLEQKTGVQEEIIFQKQPMYIKLGRVDEAVADVEKLVKIYPADARYLLLIGEMYEANEMYDKAIQTYYRALKVDSNYIESYLSLAEVFRKKGNEKEYQRLVKQAFSNPKLDIDSKIVTFIPYIERLSKDTSLSEEVMQMAEMIEKAHPDDVKAITAKADVLYNSGKKKEAQAYYEKSIGLTDVPATVWIQMYILDTELEDFDHLMVYTQKGIAANPKDPFGYFYHAIACQQKKSYQQAADVLLKAFSVLSDKEKKSGMLTPQLKLQMLITLGDVSYELKNYARSDSAYESALEIDPNNATVLNNYAYYLSERDETMLEKAERMSKKSNLLVDNNSAFLDTYAWIMFKMKNYDEALDWIEEAMQQTDARERAELLSHYGDILFKNGQVEKAIQQWQRAIEKGGDKEILEKKIKNRKID